MNDHYMTYLISPSINDCVVIHLISSYNIRLFNYSPAVVVPIHRQTHAWSHEYSVLVPKILDMHLRKIIQNSHLCQPVDQSKLSCLLLLPCCMAITGYHTIRNTSYNQWLVTDKQEICYQTRVSQGEKTTTKGI